jgi:alanine racemase
MDNHNSSSHLTQVIIHLDRLSHNMRLLQQQVGDRPLWPAIKANAYGHGAEIIARHLVDLGYDTLCVAHVFEAAALLEAGIEATFIILSATLPEHAEAIVAHGCEPAICTMDMAEALARAAERDGRCAPVHLKVDTGMGRMGIRPDEAVAFLDRCRQLPGLTVRGIMSHFPRADESDKGYSLEQIERFRQVLDMTRGYGIEVRHMANSAAILDLPGSYFDAARPGIAIYGLRPSAEMRNPVVQQLRPALEWKSRITFLKEVPAGTGLSYGHAFHTERDSLIATVPVGYGDGLSRRLSGNIDMLVRGRRCKQVGRITMDQSLLDVTRLHRQVEPGDEVVLIGRQGEQEITADELAGTLGTINYEIVTAIAQRVHRVTIGPGAVRSQAHTGHA